MNIIFNKLFTIFRNIRFCMIFRMGNHYCMSKFVVKRIDRFDIVFPIHNRYHKYIVVVVEF